MSFIGKLETKHNTEFIAINSHDEIIVYSGKIISVYDNQKIFIFSINQRNLCNISGMID